MKHLLLILLLTACGHDDSSSQASPTPTPLVNNKKDSPGYLEESRAQLLYGQNFCADNDVNRCYVKYLRKEGTRYGVYIQIDYPDRTEMKAYYFASDRDKLLETSVKGHDASCVKPLRIEFIQNKWFVLVHPGCDDTETVIATWHMNDFEA